MDGTPLTNAYVKLNISPRRFWDSRNSRFDGVIWADPNGFLAVGLDNLLRYVWLKVDGLLANACKPI